MSSRGTRQGKYLVSLHDKGFISFAVSANQLLSASRALAAQMQLERGSQGGKEFLLDLQLAANVVGATNLVGRARAGPTCK